MVYIIPTLTFIIYLLTLFLIIRFIFTPEWLSWVFPLIISIVFTVSQAYQSFALMKSETFSLDLFSVFPTFVTKANTPIIALLISTFWLLSVLLFYKAIKKTRKPKDKRKEAMKSNYHGALYTQKLETKKIDYLKKRRLEEKNFGFQKPKTTPNGKKWVELFEDNTEEKKWHIFSQE